jgi:ribosomal-protein-alanine N-acetyltransferase
MSAVRPAQSGDLETVREIQQTALAEPCPELLPVAVEGLFSCVVVTAADDHSAGSPRAEPVGYAVYIPGGERVYLPELAIDPDYQEQGYGSTLLEAVCDSLAEEEYERVRLTAHAEDERVHRFYREHGFEMVERAPDQFEDGDGVVFERVFDRDVDAPPRRSDDGSRT